MRRALHVFAIACVAAAVVAVAGDRLYGANGDKLDVPTYTGCLSAESGAFYGFAGQVDCKAGDEVVQLSSGDVTAVAAGEGMEGGGENGAVQLQLDPKYRLPQDCGAGEVAAFGGGGWGCLAPLEPSDFAKSGQSCPEGTVVAGISPLGTLVCVRGGAGPATDWTGVSTSLTEARRCAGCANSVMVYNPNAAAAQMTVRAFDREGRELEVRRIAPGFPLCRDVVIPAGGSRDCSVQPGPAFAQGAVYVRADLPVLPFGTVPEATIQGHAWQLDWYPFCPEHVGCDG